MADTVVTTYVNPDLDGTAAAFGYAEFLTKTGTPARAAIFGTPLIEARFVADRLRLQLPGPGVPAGSAVILVDMSDAYGLPEGIEPGQVIEVIDHRREYDVAAYPNARYLMEQVGACATIIAEKFRERQVQPSPAAAMLLYGGIASNTLNFQARVTTDRDVAIAGWLKQLASIPDQLVHDMFAAKSELAGDALPAAIEGDFKWFLIGGKKIGIAQLEVIGAEKLATVRRLELFQLLSKLRAEQRLAGVFLSLIDLEAGFNLFLSPDPPMRVWLEQALDIAFEGDLARRPGLVMRKELVPLLKATAASR